MIPVLYGNGVAMPTSGAASSFAYGATISVTATVPAGWSVSAVSLVNRPSGSASLMTSATALPSSFTIDVAGRYRVRVILTGPGGAQSVAFGTIDAATPVRGLVLPPQSSTVADVSASVASLASAAEDSPRVHVAPITGTLLDAGPTLNAKIRDACNPTNGFRIVEIPGNARDIPIATPIDIVDDDERGNVRGVTLRAPNAVLDGGADQRVIWNGANGGTAIKVHSRGVVLEGFAVQAGSGSLAKAIDITKAGGTNAGVCTHVTLRNVRVRGGGAGTTNGIVVGDLVNGAYPQNCDYLRFERVSVDTVTNACVFIPNNTGQIKAVVFDQCVFTFAAYGIYAARAGYAARSCGFGRLTTAAVYAGASADPLLFDAVDAEWCAKFLLTAGPSTEYWPISFVGGRYDVSAGLVPGGRYIDVGFNGPLSFVGSMFQGPANSAFHIYASTAVGVSVATVGCIFPQRTGGDDAGLVRGAGVRWTRLGCQRSDTTNGTASLLNLV